jgi:hypothetical protein
MIAGDKKSKTAATTIQLGSYVWKLQVEVGERSLRIASRRKRSKTSF